MKNQRIFVSGGAGVIGMELIPLLLKRGAKVLVGDLKTKPLEISEDIQYRQGDLNTLTESEIEDFAPELFIHLAATFEQTTETYEFWEENFLHNVRLSHHLMTILKNIPSLKRVVFASSYLIYDPALYLFDKPQIKPVSLKENAPINPRNLTGMAKLAHEKELRFLNNFCSNQFSTVCARIYRGYGRNSQDVISRWIRSLLIDEPITVFRPEGMFDYIYAKDSAEGLARLAENDSVTGIVNLGTSHSRKVQDVLDILSQHFQQIKLVEQRSSIPFEASQADMSCFEKLIGWLPEYGLEEGIQEIISYEKEKFNKNQANV